MSILNSYDAYFQDLITRYAPFLGNVAFGREHLGDVFDGIIRTVLPNNGSYIFLNIKPVTRPMSNGNSIDAELIGGFIILKNIPIRDVDNADLDNADYDVFEKTKDFLAKMIMDSRNGLSFWHYGLDSLENDKVDIENMPLLKTLDGSFVGQKLIFTITTPYISCDDFAVSVAKFA